MAAHKNGPWYTVAVVQRQLDVETHEAVLRLAGVNILPGTVIGAPHVSSDVLLVPAQDMSQHPQDMLNPAGIHVDGLPLSSLRTGVHGQCFAPGK